MSTPVLEDRTGKKPMLVPLATKQLQLDDYGEAAYKGSPGPRGGWQKRLAAVAVIGPLNVIDELPDE
ncbi:hypothetical protein N7451_000947 [Penicillium sp. IBT 35674x]|nr:hypothetical protein N7451_000947 [Penicillium sp. IBT 35674x]